MIEYAILLEAAKEALEYFEDTLDDWGWDFETDPRIFFDDPSVGVWMGEIYIKMHEAITAIEEKSNG